jgi:hypothetical protein
MLAKHYMAQSTAFPPPRALNVAAPNMAEEWKNWLQRYDIFITAVEGQKKPDSVQVAMFLSCIGEEALHIFNTFAMTDEERAKMADVRRKFVEYFTPRKNQVFERYQFWRLQQQHGEGIDAFVTSLRLRARSCEFAELTDSLIRDKVVLSCPDARLQERLLRESDLSLAKAIDLCHAAEATHQQLRAIKAGTDLTTAAQTVSAITTSSSAGPVQKKCGNCGGQHAHKSCPAYGKTCHNCEKMNHFASCCRSRQQNGGSDGKPHHKGKKYKPRNRSQSRSDNRAGAASVHTADVDSHCDSLYIGQLSVDAIDSGTSGRHGNSWMKMLHIQGADINCKLDSGAQANVMSRVTYEGLQQPPAMRPTSSSLVAYNNNRIKPLGVATLAVDVRGTSHQLEFYIVSHDAATIIGLPSCTQLDFIRRVDAVSAPTSPTPPSSDLLTAYSDVFGGLGRYPGEFHIVLREGAVPVIHPPRRVALTLQPRLKEALDNMERLGVISKRDEPTDWVNSLLIVEKKSGALRLCLDPRDLNQWIKREHFLIPTADDVTPHLYGMRVFSVIDMKDSFWQVVLDEESSRLCTFSCAYGRYSFRRLPFGVSVAPEVMQKRNSELFGDIPGVHVVFDDIIVAGKDDREHDERLRTVLERARRHNVRFNKDKIQYKVSEVKYVGHLMSAQGLRPDPEKVRAINDMATPASAQDLSRFLGMANYLSRYVPNYTSVTQPLRPLLRDDVEWAWSTSHDAAFRRVKDLIASAPVLRFFDPSVSAVIQTDASSGGLGSCLLQNGQPVAYASRALTDPETRYAQIEKELLAIVFACNKFAQYVYGRHTLVHSDHKPLEVIFKKSICQTTPRLQRMLLALLKFDLEVVYKPGKEMHIADALSRAYLTTPLSPAERELAEDIDVTVHTVLHDSNLSCNTLRDVMSATDADPVLSQLRELVRHGFPSDISLLPEALRCYHSIVHSIHEVDGVLLHEEKVIIPDALKAKMLAMIHEGHLGQEKCKALARSTMFWTGMAKDIEQYVAKCSVCISHRHLQPHEPMIAHDIPARPWQKVASDIFSLYGRDYLLVVDYYSKYPEVCLLSSKTGASVVTQLKSIFSRHGIPEVLVADNMPYSSLVMRQFAASWNFTIVTSSPHYSQSNGQAERFVQTVKTLLKKAEESSADPYIALLQYRTTALSGLAYSPSQLLFGRLLRTKLPASSAALEPDQPSHKLELDARQQRQRQLYDRRSHALPELQPGDIVRVRHNDEWQPAIVSSKHPAPRSYVVESASGSMLRRNRRDILRTREESVTPTSTADDDVMQPSSSKTTSTPADTRSSACPPSQQPVVPTAGYQTRAGRSVHFPAHLSRDYDVTT